MRFKVLIFAARSHFSFSRFGDWIAVSHLATVPDNLELIGCGTIRHCFTATSVLQQSRQWRSGKSHMTFWGKPSSLMQREVSADPIDSASLSWTIHTLPWITGCSPGLWHCVSHLHLSDCWKPDLWVLDEATLFISTHLGLSQRRSHLPTAGYYVSGWLPLETRSLRSRSVKFAPCDSSVIQNL